MSSKKDLKNAYSHISIIVLAAGKSTRMKKPKLLLSWGQLSVIQTIATRLIGAGAAHIRVITGAFHEDVVLQLEAYSVEILQNPNYETDEMLQSLQFGLMNLPKEICAVLVVLGDQPQIRSETVSMIIGAYDETHASIIVPSYHMHRGHPWLIDRSHWTEISQLGSDHTLRDFLRQHEQDINYVEVDTPTILQDLDTPDDYEQYKPG